MVKKFSYKSKKNSPKLQANILGDFYKFPVLTFFNNYNNNFCMLYVFYRNLFVFLSIT